MPLRASEATLSRTLPTEAEAKSPRRAVAVPYCGTQQYVMARLTLRLNHRSSAGEGLQRLLGSGSAMAGHLGRAAQTG